MAIGATIYRFTIALADLDRGIDANLELRIACHPSESLLYFVVRVLARCLEHQEGIEVTRGVSDTELPALIVRDLQGRLTAWIEVGAPAAKRVHKATSRADRVVVYAHKQVDQLLGNLRAAELPRGEKVTVISFDDAMLEELQRALQRTATWAITRSDGTLYIDADGQSVVGPVHQQLLG